MSIAQTIFQKVKNLPEQQAQEILNFVDFIQARHDKASQSDTPSFVDLLMTIPKLKDDTVFERIHDENIRHVFD